MDPGTDTIFFLSQNVHTSYVVHPASYRVISHRGLKRPRHEATHHLVPTLRISGALPPSAHTPCSLYPDSFTFQCSSFQSTSCDLQPGKTNTNDTRVHELDSCHGISRQKQSYHTATLQRQRTYSGSTTAPSHSTWRQKKKTKARQTRKSARSNFTPNDAADP